MTNRISLPKIFKNFSSLVIGKVLGDVFTFLFFVVLSRTFGQEGIGAYSFAMALTGFLVVFADFGLSDLSIKEMSRRSESLCEYFGKVLSLRFILAIAVFVFMVLMLYFFSFPRETIVIIAIIGTYQVLYSLVDGLATIFIAQEDMHFAGIIDASFRMVSALSGIVLIKIGCELDIVLYVLPALSIICLIITYLIAVKKYGKFKLILSLSFLTHTLSDAIPYLLSVLLRRLMTRMDVIFLGFLIGLNATGVYNVGYRVVFLLFLVPRFIGTTLLPIASRLYGNSQDDLVGLYHKSLGFICLIGLPTAAGIWLVAPDLINLFFGKNFIESTLILRYLAWLILLMFFVPVMGTFLTACDRQVDRTRSQFVAACCNVIGNAILIPMIGIMGAVIATLFSETVLVILLSWHLKGILGWPKICSRLTMSGVATFAFVSPFVFYKTQSLFITIPVAIFIYMGVLLFFKEIRRNELQILITLFKSGFRKEALTG
ncbi:MAG: flippase [Planctomycetota bacterium]|jgi:O-antigen/teichoic acid export membrane protein